MRKVDLTNNLDITINLTCLSKIYFTFSSDDITYLGTKTASHNFSLKEKLNLKRSLIRNWKFQGIHMMWQNI